MIILWSTPKKFNLISWLISKFIGAKYSHTALCFKYDNRWVVFHATRKGVHCISYEKFKEKNEIIEHLDVLDHEKQRKAFNFCIDNLGVKYGFLTILSIALNIRFSDGSRTMICSELVARSLDLGFNKLDQIDPKELKDLLAGI